MSRHYLEMATQAFDGQSVDIESALAQLAETHPELAALCAEINWTDVRVQCAVKAVQALAKETGNRFSTSYDNRWSTEVADGRPPSGGKCIGVISNGSNVSLGVSVDAKGGLSFFCNAYSRDRGVSTWKEQIEFKYREHAVEAMLQIIGEEVVVERTDGGDFRRLTSEEPAANHE